MRFTPFIRINESLLTRSIDTDKEVPVALQQKAQQLNALKELNLEVRLINNVLHLLLILLANVFNIYQRLLPFNVAARNLKRRAAPHPPV